MTEVDRADIKKRARHITQVWAVARCGMRNAAEKLEDVFVKEITNEEENTNEDNTSYYIDSKAK